MMSAFLAMNESTFPTIAMIGDLNSLSIGINLTISSVLPLLEIK